MANERFVGGDNLTAVDGMRFYFHKSVMNNELIGGKGAYQISNAQKGESGPSFGPIQYDVGGNVRGRELLESIAKQAVDGQGNRFIDDAELAQAKSHLYKPFKNFSNADWNVYNHLKPQLDQALNSEQGRDLIHQDYLVALDKKVEHLKDVIGSVKNPDNRVALEQNPLAQMMIIDTENQFGVKVNQGLKAFLNRSELDGDVKVPYSGQNVAVRGQIGLEDIVRYKLETAYGQTDAGCRDLLRRTSNIINAVGIDNINLTPEDHVFLKTGLKEFLVQNGHGTKMLDDSALSGLKALANKEATVTQPIPNQTQPFANPADYGALEVPTRYAALHGQVGQHIGREYNERGIAWSNGGDNTVAACTVECVKQNVTDVQHVSVDNGKISLGQKDGHMWHVATVDATQAARTPVSESFGQLAALDLQPSLRVDNPVQTQDKAHSAPIMT